jgi:hypothetical protein
MADANVDARRTGRGSRHRYSWRNQLIRYDALVLPHHAELIALKLIVALGCNGFQLGGLVDTRCLRMGPVPLCGVDFYGGSDGDDAVLASIFRSKRVISASDPSGRSTQTWSHSSWRVSHAITPPTAVGAIGSTHS